MAHKARPAHQKSGNLAPFAPVPEPTRRSRIELTFDEPQRALTPGQICALYDGERLLGGGVFEEICYE